MREEDTSQLGGRHTILCKLLGDVRSCVLDLPHSMKLDDNGFWSLWVYLRLKPVCAELDWFVILLYDELNKIHFREF